MANRIMAHMIPWYPDQAGSLAIAQAIVAGGAAYLEVQFAFSDPSADGPVIEQACRQALQAGFKIAGGFAFVRQVADWIAQYCPPADRPKIFIMTYASLVVARGISRFVQEAVQAGAAGLIVPDLPPDSDEGLYEAGQKHGLHIVPVLVPFVSPARIELTLAKGPEYLYCALRAGITGQKTELSSPVLQFLSAAGASGAKVLGGFGICEAAQVAALAPNVHAAVVGSQLVRLIGDHRLGAGQAKSADYRALQQAVRQFVGELVQAT